MHNDVLIPFAISKNSGELVSIDDVDSGLACDCKCMSCGVSMVARKGEDKAHHFAHRSTEVDPLHACDFNINRAIFWMVREVAKELSYVELPEFVFSHYDRGRKLTFSQNVCKSFRYPVNRVSIPHKHYSESHDVLHLASDTEEFDLILVTSFSPDTVLLKELLNYQMEPVHIVILNLNHLKHRLGQIQNGFKTEIYNYLIENHIDKQWEYHPDLDEAVEAIKEQITNYFNTLKKSALKTSNVRQRINRRNSTEPISREALKEQLGTRLDELVQAAMDVKEIGYDEGYLCTACKFISPPDVLSCGYCGEQDFECFELSDQSISSLRPKFDCWLYPRESLKIVPLKNG